MGSLDIIADMGRIDIGRRVVQYRCCCGTVKTAQLSDITSGRIQSCGCLKRSLASERQLKRFGDLSGTVFESGVRVLRPSKKPLLKNGKRIRGWVCECPCGREFVSAANVLRVGQVTSCGCNGAELFRYRGKMMTVGEIARMANYPQQRLRYRLVQKRMSVTQALSKPAKAYTPPKLYQFKGKRLSLYAIAKLTGVKPESLRYRVWKKGMTISDAIASCKQSTLAHLPPLR